MVLIKYSTCDWGSLRACDEQFAWFYAPCVCLSHRWLKSKSNMCSLTCADLSVSTSRFACFVLLHSLWRHCTEHSHSCQYTNHYTWHNPAGQPISWFILQTLQFSDVSEQSNKGQTYTFNKIFRGIYSFSSQIMHEVYPDLWPSGSLCRCLAETHKELPDERKAGRFHGWLSGWKGDCCRGAG